MYGNIRTNDRLGTDFRVSLTHEFCTNQSVHSYMQMCLLATRYRSTTSHHTQQYTQTKKKKSLIRALYSQCELAKRAKKRRRKTMNMWRKE